jgi:hypothetical protein
MTFEDFKNYYVERGSLPNDVGRRKNKLNDKQIKSRYDKYLKSEQKKIDRRERLNTDDKWKELVSNLDLTRCALVDRLMIINNDKDLSQLYEKAGPWIDIIDPAHIFGKGSYPHMKYDKENILPLNRYSHSCLDQNRDPITGEPISNEEIRKIWKLLVGIERYNKLLKRSMNE